MLCQKALGEAIRKVTSVLINIIAKDRAQPAEIFHSPRLQNRQCSKMYRGHLGTQGFGFCLAKSISLLVLQKEEKEKVHFFLKAIVLPHTLPLIPFKQPHTFCFSTLSCPPLWETWADKLTCCSQEEKMKSEYKTGTLLRGQSILDTTGKSSFWGWWLVSLPPYIFI